MKRKKIQGVIRWAIAFSQNLTGDVIDRGLTDEELEVAAEDFLRGEDPWESAAAIFEGRTKRPIR